MNTLFENNMDMQQQDMFTKKNKPLEEVVDWVENGELRIIEYHPLRYIQHYDVLLNTGEDKILQAVMQDSGSPIHYSRPPKLEISYVNTADLRTQLTTTLLKIGSMSRWKETLNVQWLQEQIAWNGNVKLPDDLVNEILKLIQLFYEAKGD